VGAKREKGKLKKLFSNKKIELNVLPAYLL
jgi:hypothetical protein